MKKFDVVVNASRVFEDRFLEAIDDLDRIEVITNSNCTKNCKLAASHYSAIANALKVRAECGEGEEFQKAREIEHAIYDACMKIKQADRMANQLSMSDEQVKLLVSKGVKHLKIEGREYCDAALLSDLARYVCEGHMLYRFITRSIA